MPTFPNGVVTLVFTDIEGSSALWEAHREAFAPVLDEHNRLLRAAAAAWNGVEVKTEGDAFFLVFARASDAVRFSVDAQLALQEADWNAHLGGLAELRVRIGMHTGEPILAEHPGGAADYFGPVVNRAARVGAAGHGGQVVVSEATRSLANAEIAVADALGEISFIDLGRHQLKGVGEELLWQVCHPSLPDRFPALKIAGGPKHNLPSQTTPFIGRERELAQWCELLSRDDVRLLTLIGFGGHGKTRSALQVAETLSGSFADGAWWVELEEARDPEAMVARIAHELRLHLQPQPSVREQLINFHRDRELLLVLDNTEQIENAGQVVSDLLAAGPRIKCLVTTRRALEIRQERTVQVPPLPPSEAAALFAERAASRDSGFNLNAENRADVEELCRRLEGIPLAIELAASRISVLAPREMIDRLDEQFRLLQTRSPDLPPRQRALRGAIDWSYELLTEDDKALLAELSVFAGGFDMKAAEDVCDGFDALEGVAELLRHSLLRSEQNGGGTRFSMLESVRAYAAEKLGETSGGDVPVRLRHAKYFAKVIETLVGRLRTRDEAAALDKFLLERANIRAALDFAAAAGEATLAARIAPALFEPLYRLGFWAEARAALNKGFACQGALTGSEQDKSRLSSVLLLRSASLSQDTGDLVAANAGASESLALAEAGGDVAAQAAALNLLGLLATDGDDDAETAAANAAARFEAALALQREGDHNGRAIALHNLARLASRRGAIDEAQRLYEEALAQRRLAGDARGEAETLGNLGVLAQNRGELGGARSLYLESLQLRRALRDRMGIALMLYNLGEVAELDGDDAGSLGKAIGLFVHAGQIFREIGSAYAAAPAEALQKLSARLGRDYASLLAAAESDGWETFAG